MSSPKYSAGGNRRLLRDRDGGWVALTDHALHRWRTRTPHECPVSVHEAWREGEWIKHPQVAQSDGEAEPPEDVRVFRWGQQWGVVFLVVTDESASPVRTNDADRVVCTIANLQTRDHGPARAYVYSHGPHIDPEH